MSILNNSLLLGADAGAAGYQISRSLRFNSSDSGFCARTPSTAGNRKTWTWAGWVKRSALGTDQNIFGTNSTTGLYFQFQGDNTFKVLDYTGSTSNYRLETTQVFKDVGAWMHILFALDTTLATANDRIKLYVNGTQITTFSTRVNPSQNFDGVVNSTTTHTIGRLDAQWYLDGYLADIHFIDGQALTPSSFTEVSATTGQLIPKAYSGTYGTNGFHLPFSDNSTAAALGTDTSGNGNTWTVNNLSVTAGAGNDSLVDTPTSYGTDTGAGGEVRGNYATLNPLNKGSNLTISNGNLDVSGSTGHATVLTTIPVVAGMKSYMEFTVTTDGAGGWGVTTNPAAENSYGMIAGKWWVYDNGGTFGIINQSSGTDYSSRVNNGDVLQLAIDYSTGKVHVGINNTWINSTNGTDGNPATGANPTFTLSTTAPIFPIFESASLLAAANFGQRQWAYAAPSGFRPLVDTLLPAPVVAKPSTVFDTKLYTSNAGSLTVSGLGFSPDFAWLKSRGTAVAHALYDTVRGAGRALKSNTTESEQYTTDGFVSFNSDGFTLGANVNSPQPDINYTGSVARVAWCWDAGSSTVSNTQGSITSQVRANASAGFSVVTYTGNGTSGATVGHGLNVAPQLLIVKRRSSAGSTANWAVWHGSLTAGQNLFLNTTDSASAYSPSRFTSTLPTSTVFSVGGGDETNYSGGTFVCYAFAPVAGYSSFGSYTGNGSADGPFVYTGFRPRWLLLKCSSVGDSFQHWHLFDTSRSTGNISKERLQANSSAAEDSFSTIDLLSSGFKLRYTDAYFNQSGATYIYFAVAESPFQYARAR